MTAQGESPRHIVGAVDGPQSSTETIRSMALSSAELWHDMLQRVAEVQEGQILIAQAIAELGAVVYDLSARTGSALGPGVAAAAVTELEAAGGSLGAPYTAPEGVAEGDSEEIDVASTAEEIDVASTAEEIDVASTAEEIDVASTAEEIDAEDEADDAIGDDVADGKGRGKGKARREAKRTAKDKARREAKRTKEDEARRKAEARHRARSRRRFLVLRRETEKPAEDGAAGLADAAESHDDTGEGVEFDGVAGAVDVAIEFEAEDDDEAHDDMDYAIEVGIDDEADDDMDDAIEAGGDEVIGAIEVEPAGEKVAPADSPPLAGPPPSMPTVPAPLLAFPPPRPAVVPPARPAIVKDEPVASGSIVARLRELDEAAGAATSADDTGGPGEATVEIGAEPPQPTTAVPPTPQPLLYTPTAEHEAKLAVGAGGPDGPALAASQPVAPPLPQPLVYTPAASEPVKTPPQGVPPVEGGRFAPERQPEMEREMEAEPEPEPEPVLAGVAAAHSSASMATEILASTPVTETGAGPGEPEALVISEDVTLINRNRKRRLQIRMR